jgi:hypothetical protein
MQIISKLFPTRNFNLQRFNVLYAISNFSGMLSQLHRSFRELEIKRGFHHVSAVTILEEAYHSLIIVEQDPILYEDSQEMVEYIQQALKQAAHEATVLLARNRSFPGRRFALCSVN